MSLLIEESQIAKTEFKSENSFLNNAMMVGIVLLTSVLLSVGFSQQFAKKNSNISMIVVNNGKQPPTKEIATKINNELPGGGDGGGGDTGTQTLPAPDSLPVAPLPTAPKNNGVIHPDDLPRGQPPRGYKPI